MFVYCLLLLRVVITGSMTMNRPNWVPDGSAKTCHSCTLSFTLTRRRHHCRNCGQVSSTHNREGDVNTQVIFNFFS